MQPYKQQPRLRLRQHYPSRLEEAWLQYEDVELVLNRILRHPSVSPETFHRLNGEAQALLQRIEQMQATPAEVRSYVRYLLLSLVRTLR